MINYLISSGIAIENYHLQIVSSLSDDLPQIHLKECSGFHEIQEYIEVGRGGKRVFGIKVSYPAYNPNSEVKLLGNLICIGAGSAFYIYDLNKQVLAKQLLLNSPFYSFHSDGDEIFISSDTEIWCIGKDGEVHWRSDILGVEGVRISKIAADIIEGDGSWDPPGGWNIFRLQRSNGAYC